MHLPSFFGAKIHPLFGAIREGELIVVLVREVPAPYGTGNGGLPMKQYQTLDGMASSYTPMGQRLSLGDKPTAVPKK